jgi:hypothetical protein
MKLLTKAIIKKLPSIYETDEVELGDKVAICKFFCPWGRFTFYVCEADQEEDNDWTFWGYCVSPLGSDCDEFGYVTMSELLSIKHFSGLGIERDKWFDPIKLSELSDVKISK